MRDTDQKPEMSGGERRSNTHGEDASQAEVLADTRTHLAWVRTRMNLESFLAGWVRTATSLIGFGFAIVQFFSFNQSQHIVRTRAMHLAPYVGLGLIGIGTLATGIAIRGYRIIVRYLDNLAGPGSPDAPPIPGIRRTYPDPALVVAILVCLIGVLAFFAILAGEDLPWPGRH